MIKTTIFEEYWSRCHCCDQLANVRLLIGKTKISLCEEHLKDIVSSVSAPEKIEASHCQIGDIPYNGD